MPDFQTLLSQSAARHNGRLCPRQVLGARMGLYVAELLGLDLPQTDKRLFAFVETDGCLTDGIAVTTGCWLGRRTMRLIDYGRIAATFVDTQTGRALRITPVPGARDHCADYAPDEPDRWHAIRQAYQVMPTAQLLRFHEVALAVSLEEILARPGEREICAQCGEEIINQRFVHQAGRMLCRACAEGAYYQ